MLALEWIANVGKQYLPQISFVVTCQDFMERDRDAVRANQPGS